MRSWVFDRIRDALYVPPAVKHAANQKPDKPWTDYRGGSTQVSVIGALTRWDDAQALMTILMSAVTADNSTDPKERETLNSIIERAPTFRRRTRNEISDIISSAGDEIKKNRVAALEKATRSFVVSDSRRSAAYLMALDVLYADLQLLESEKRFARELADMLCLDDPALRTHCDRLMAAKNWKDAMQETSQKIEDRHRAFFTLLAAAVLIDGVELKEETQELEALMTRTKTLAHFESPARVQLRNEVSETLKRNFATQPTMYDHILWACDTLIDMENTAGTQYQGICFSAYLHAVDLVFADHREVESERRFLNELDTRFSAGLPGWSGMTPSAAQAKQMIKDKNRY